MASPEDAHISVPDVKRRYGEVLSVTVRAEKDGEWYEATFLPKHNGEGLVVQPGSRNSSKYSGRDEVDIPAPFFRPMQARAHAIFFSEKTSRET